MEARVAKKNFYKKKIADLKISDPRKWYSSLKRITSFDEVKNEVPIVDEIRYLSDQEQADIIAEKFSSIQNEYDPLKVEDISIPTFESKDIPIFSVATVWLALTKINVNKSTVAGDFPAKLIKKLLLT